MSSCIINIYFILLQLKLLTFSLYSHNVANVQCMFHNLCSKWRAIFIRKSKLFWWMWLVQSVFERVDVIGWLTVWYRGKSYSIFTCELVWKISGLNLVWNFSYMKFFIHEIGVTFLSDMFNLVPHVKFLICIHFKHVSDVNQVWNRPDLMRIFCTGYHIKTRFAWFFWFSTTTKSALLCTVIMLHHADLFSKRNNNHSVILSDSQKKTISCSYLLISW